MAGGLWHLADSALCCFLFLSFEPMIKPSQICAARALDGTKLNSQPQAIARCPRRDDCKKIGVHILAI